MRRTNTQVAGSAVALGLLLLAACGGGGDDAAPSTSTSTTVVTTPPTTTSPATTAPPTTPAPTAPPTTAPPTAPPTTAPPTTQPRDVIAEVTAAAFAYDDWYVACLRAPIDCDPQEVALVDSDAFINLSDLSEELAVAGLYVGPEDPGYMVVEAVEQLADHVLVTVCGYTTMVLYGPPGPDGVPTVQNDTPGTVREAWQFVEDGAAWKIRRGDTLSEVDGVNECPPEP